jgi:hypothetical protein
MKISKATQNDVEIAFELATMLDVLGHSSCPSMPTKIAFDGNEDFDPDDNDQCGRALRAMLATANRGNLLRLVWGAEKMLEVCVDPNSKHIQRHPDAVAGADAKQARPISDWHEACGVVLWWSLPVEEPPYCGRPDDDDWPGYHSHWTPIVVPHSPGE